MLPSILIGKNMFSEAFNKTIVQEGRYSNNPSDAGGRTKWGISQNSYPDLDIPNLTFLEAKEIYRKDYWNTLYNKLDSKIAYKLFDLGVNLGVNKSIKVLQIALNRHYQLDLKVDGLFGQKTLEACTRQNARTLLNVYIFEASLTYKKIAKRNNNIIFLKGWLNRLYKT